MALEAVLIFGMASAEIDSFIDRLCRYTCPLVRLSSCKAVLLSSFKAVLLSSCEAVLL